jgi:hypothetical protein
LPILSYNVYRIASEPQDLAAIPSSGNQSMAVSIPGDNRSLVANITSGTTATLTELIDGSSYTFEVAAVNANGEGTLASSASITPYQLVTLTLSNMSQIYTGSALQASAFSTPAGAPISFSYAGDRTNVGGNCVATASVTGNAFQGADVSGFLVISKKAAEIVLSNLTQLWTGSALQATVTTVPAGLATIVAYQGNRTNVGLYPFTVDISDNNYKGDASGVLKIAVNAASAVNAIAQLDPTTADGLASLSSATKDVVAEQKAAVAAAAAPARAAAIAAQKTAITNVTNSAFQVTKAKINA